MTWPQDPVWTVTLAQAGAWGGKSTREGTRRTPDIPSTRSYPATAMTSSGEATALFTPHTHLRILAMVVSATRTKSSSGDSWTPLGNRSWSNKTLTSLVSVSYSSRLGRPDTAVTGGKTWHLPWAWGRESDSVSHWGDKTQVRGLYGPGPKLASKGPSCPHQILYHLTDQRIRSTQWGLAHQPLGAWPEA